MQTLRFAPGAIASRYPLAVGGAARWSRHDGGWVTEIPLPELPNDYIVVPSVAQFDGPASDYVLTLSEGAGVWTLRPTANQACSAAPADPRVTTHIDYFHCRAALRAPVLRIAIASAATPTLYLLTVAWRAFRIAAESGRAVTQRLIVPALSQQTAPRSMRHRICSPTCVTMALRYHGRDATLADVAAACYHAPSHLYGVWPLAISCAAAANVVAAAECFVDLDAVASVVARGLPVVASIRFGEGALPGAPLSATDGHLVVVTGFDSEWVYVNDPAAKDASSVPRQYPRHAFAAAWLTERGVGYVLSPR
jgi:uncharacterized protein YvpB